MCWKIVAVGYGVIHRNVISHVRKKWFPPSNLAGLPVMSSKKVGLTGATGNCFFPCYSNKYDNDAFLWLKITPCTWLRTCHWVLSSVFSNWLSLWAALGRVCCSFPSFPLHLDHSWLMRHCGSWPVPRVSLWAPWGQKPWPCSLLHPNLCV